MEISHRWWLKTISKRASFLKSKSVYLIFKISGPSRTNFFACFPQAISSGPCWFKSWSFFIPTFSTPAKSLCTLLPKDFNLCQLSHFQAWLAVPYSPLDSPFFLHSPVLTLTLPPGLLLCSQSRAFWGLDCARIPRTSQTHGFASGSQALGYKPSLPFQALTCPRHHVRSVISLKSYSLFQSENFAVLTKANSWLVICSSSPVPFTSASHTLIPSLCFKARDMEHFQKKIHFFCFICL